MPRKNVGFNSLARALAVAGIVLSGANALATVNGPGTLGLICRLYMSGEVTSQDLEVRMLREIRSQDSAMDPKKFESEVYHPMVTTLGKLGRQVFHGPGKFIEFYGSVATFHVPIAERLPGLGSTLVEELNLAAKHEKPGPYHSPRYGDFSSVQEFIFRVSRWLTKPENAQAAFTDYALEGMLSKEAALEFRQTGKLENLKITEKEAHELFTRFHASGNRAWAYTIGGFQVPSTYLPVFMTNKVMRATLEKLIKEEGDRKSVDAAAALVRYAYENDKTWKNDALLVELLKAAKARFPWLKADVRAYEKSEAHAVHIGSYVKD